MGTRKEGEIKKEENRNVKMRKDFRTKRTEGKKGIKTVRMGDKKKGREKERKNSEGFEEKYKGG